MSYDQSSLSVASGPCNGLSFNASNELVGEKGPSGVNFVSDRPIWNTLWSGTGSVEIPVRSLIYTNNDPCRRQKVLINAVHGNIWAGTNTFSAGSSFRIYPRFQVVTGTTPPATPGYDFRYMVVHKAHAGADAYTHDSIASRFYQYTVAPGNSLAMSIGGTILFRQGAPWTGSVRIYMWQEQIVVSAEAI